MLKVRRTRRSEPPSGGVTIIAHNSRCEADMQLQGKMHIDGYFSGRLHLDDHLSVGRKGVLRGDVCAPDVTVSGIFEGNLVCRSLHLLKGARVRGHIRYVELEQDPRASLTGKAEQLDSLPHNEFIQPLA